MQQEAVILSGELCGLQAVTESMAPEGIAPFMNAISAVIETTVRSHHGSLNRFTGDTFMSVFHPNKTGKPAAIHAVDTALELNHQIQSLIQDKKPDQTFNLKIGIASGSILSAEIGTKENMQQTIMGEAVNHAGHVCRFAGEGQILIDQPTHEVVKDHCLFRPLEPIPLKGGTESLAIFELLEKKRKKIDVTGMERKIASEMVGRGRESEQLESLIKKLIAGKGSVVNIVGKAGVGKSRLLAEMKVQPIMENVLLLEGRAMSTGKNLSFHPIIDLIKSWATITEEDLPAVSSEKLQKGIHRISPDKADEIYSFLATMMGLPLTGKYKERVMGIEGEALEKLILKNLRDLIISATKDKPRIYMIEDMHWADSSSLAMFESLYKLSQNYPVMFINVLRPGYKETGDYILKWLVDNMPGDNITINVSPLEEKESVELIGNLLKNASLPDKVAGAIIRKTEGNPFFIEEVIRSFLDEGIIDIKEKEFIVTERIHEVNIPETINDVILSRVDKLDEKTRELLNTASVMGRNFYYKVLEEAANTIEELDDRLAYLTEVELISESQKKREIEYLFKHALAHQATYESILMDNKKELHLKIARSIEKVFNENLNEFYATLAYHYEKAGDLLKTQEYLVKAGDESMKSGASSEALHYYKDALDGIPENRKQDISDLEIRDLEFKIASACHAIGENIEARKRFEALSSRYFGYHFSKSKYPLLLKGILSLFKFMFIINNKSLYFKKEVDDKFHLFSRIVKYWGESTATSDPKYFALNGFQALVYLSQYQLLKSINGLSVFVESAALYMWTGISFDVSNKMLEYAQSGNADQDPVSRATYRFSLKMHDFMTGKWEEDSDYQELYKLTMDLGQFWPLAIYLVYTAMVNVELGKIDAFQDGIQKLNELAESFDNSHAKAQMYRIIVPGYFRFRKMDLCQNFFEEAIDYTSKTGHSAMLLVIYSAISQFYTLQGELAKARKAFAEAEKLIDRNKIITIYYCPYLLAKTKLEFSELKEMPAGSLKYKSQLKSVLKSAEKLISKSKKMKGSLAESYLLKAEIYQFRQKHAQAFRYYQLAIATGVKYNGRLDLSRAYFETGKFLSDPKTKYKELNGKPAGYYLEKARSMFEEMDLKWDMEEYRKFVDKI